MRQLFLSLALVPFASCQDLFLPKATDAASAAKTKPHILFLLIDDLGWAEVGWNRAQQTPEVSTPNMDGLAAQGAVLDRHYVHKFCSPTRCAIQTGRAPIHVNVINAPPNTANASDDEGGFAGIPRSMTGIAEVMRTSGYRTHMVGKWDVGMATGDHTPAGRGYETSLIYFHHSNDCWTSMEEACGQTPVRDLWNMHGDIAAPGRPAHAKVNSPECSYKNQTSGDRCVYEDELFEERVTDIIRHHDVSDPLFLFWATRTAHGALQPPDSELAKFDSIIDYTPRRQYHAMVSWIDGAVGRVVTALKDKNMYDNTLIVMSSDNGGPLPSANNFPLKGGKFSDWEGGIRVASFVSGGFLPASARGTKVTSLIAAWDWYATFAGLAGADATDKKAEKAGLPGHDSIDQWPLLSGTAKQPPRRRLEIGSNEDGDKGRRTGATKVGGLLVPPYKLVLGDGPGDTINIAGWTGLQSPNSTVPHPDFKGMVQECGRTPETGCLFDVFADPTEQTNLAKEKSEIFKQMLSEIGEIGASLYSPYRGEEDTAACNKALGDYNGFWGPWLD